MTLSCSPAPDFFYLIETLDEKYPVREERHPYRHFCGHWYGLQGDGKAHHLHYSCQVVGPVAVSHGQIFRAQPDHSGGSCSDDYIVVWPLFRI